MYGRTRALAVASCGGARWLTFALLAAALGCSGTIEDFGPADIDGAGRSSSPVHAEDPARAGQTDEPGSGESPRGSATPSAAPEADGCVDAPPDPGPAPLRRLSPDQYANTLRDLAGDVPGLADVLGQAAEASELGLVQADVAPVELEIYQKAAETVAAHLSADADRLEAIAPCAAGSEPRACARTFVASFGARAYRAPLTAADLDRHVALYDLGAKTSRAHGIELVVRAILQAPRFLYRVELGEAKPLAERAVRLTGHEIAARLAYVLWDSLPDEALRSAAESGKLDTTDGVRAVLVDLLADPRGQVALRRFLDRWMHLSKLDGLVKDERFYPEWNGSDLSTALREQATLFLDDVLDRQEGSLRALLTSSSVFVNADLALYYGGSPGDSFERVERSDGHASGILTLPALLSVLAKPAESSPIYRGKFVREALLCQTLPSPPPNIPKPPDVEEGVSTRERLAQHEEDPACSGCHRLMDPIGFGLENFDAIGRYRSEDSGEPVDGRGELLATRDSDGAFSGPRELGERLAASSEVQECMARQWFRFALSRFEREVDACAVRDLARAFTDSGADLRELPLALLTSEAFLTRRPPDMEDTP